MEKRIFLVFTDHPFGTNKTSEKLRMALGLFLNNDNKLHLLFLGNSRFALQELDEDKAHLKPITKHIEMLAELETAFYVESGGDFSFLNGFDFKSVLRSEVDRLLDTADMVIH